MVPSIFPTATTESRRVRSVFSLPPYLVLMTTFASSCLNYVPGYHSRLLLESVKPGCNRHIYPTERKETHFSCTRHAPAHLWFVHTPSPSRRLE
jgi:hypothetical protein